MPEPGFRVHTAPRLEALLARLAEELRGRPLASPFARETVLVAQNKALRAWVENELARALGCAASLDVRSPREAVTALTRRLVPQSRPPEGERGHPFELDGLAWRIRGVLADLPARGHGTGGTYARVHAYLERAAEDDAEGSGAMALAARLAQLYDDYQLYRPDVLAAWSRGEARAAGWPDEPWQADLWRHLVQAAPENGTGPVWDRAAATDRLLACLADPECLDGLDAERLHRVHLVGTAVVPPVFWRVLQALGAHRPVAAYAVALGPLAGAAEPRHALLRDLGGRLLEWRGLLREMGVTAEGPAAHGEGPAADAPSGANGTTPPETPSRLARLQRALCDDCPPEAPASADVASGDVDRSIRVHECHSPLRELEVLRDEILDAFGAIPGLRPGDVGVLVPDLATYAPLVDAVFGAEAAAGLRLPYHVSDPPHAPEARVLDAFARVLALDAGRATASDLLGLLDVPVVRRAARIHEGELGLLLEWVRDARIHWGRDAAHKAAFGLPEDDVHTWRFGLDRLLVGYACGPVDEVVLGRLPVAEAGVDEADLLGRFAEWATALFDGLAGLRQRRPLAQWAADLLLFVDGAFAPEAEAEVNALVAMRTAIDRLLALDEPGTVVTAQAVRGHLAGSLAGVDRHEPYVTGAVTFGTPLALRHVPFRVLAVVGLGDGFPGTDARPAFDLLGRERRPGDPDAHADDRLSALAALGAARDRLILSRTARSHMDNAERAASVALDSIQDALARAFGREAARAMVVAHPLQPTSAAYVSRQRPELFTFAEAHALPPAPPGAAEGLRFFESPEADLALPGDTVEFTAAALARAWVHPCRAHTDALGMDLRLEDAALADDEPVELDALAFHGVKRDVLSGDLAGRDAAEIADRLGRSGQLPPGDLAHVYLGRARRAVGDLAERVLAHGETRPLALRVEGLAPEGLAPEGLAPEASGGPASGEGGGPAADGPRVLWRVEAAVAYHPERGAIRQRPGAVRGTHLVRAYVEHLALCADPAVTGARRTVIHGTDGETAFGPVPAHEARALLQFMVRGALAFRAVPPPLFERASHAHAEALAGRGWAHSRRAGIVEQEAWTPLRMGRCVAPDAPDRFANVKPKTVAAYSGQYENWKDLDDPAVALCYRRRDPLHSMSFAFDLWARLLWGPVFAAMEDG